MTRNTPHGICLQFISALLLILSGCANAQEDGSPILIKGNLEMAYFFHDDEGTVTSQGWLFGAGSSGDTSLVKSSKHLSLARRKLLADGSKGGLEVFTWKDISEGSEVYFPESTEDPYQAPNNINLRLSNCSGLIRAVYSGDMARNAAIQAEENGNLRVGFAASPLDNGILFLLEGKMDDWKYLQVHPDVGLSGMVECSMLQTGVKKHELEFPTGSIVQGQISAIEEDKKLLLYKLPPNFEARNVPPILIPEDLLTPSLSYDFNIIPAEQRNLFLGRRIYRIMGNDLLGLEKITLPAMDLQKEYVTEGGFAVKAAGDFHAALAIYGLDIPLEGKVPSVNKRSQWKIFGKGSEGLIEMRLPDIPTSILNQLTGGDYIRVYNSVAIHLYQFREKPGDSAFKKMAALLDGKLDGYRDRIEYRAWLKELD